MKENLSKLTRKDKPVFRDLVKFVFGEQGQGDKKERSGLKEVL